MNSTFGLKLKELLIDWGLSEQYASIAKSFIVVAVIIMLALLSYIITNRIIFRAVGKLIHRTKFNWDDIIFDQTIFGRLAHLVPAIIIYYYAKIGLSDFPNTASLIQSAAYVYMIFAGMFVLDKLLTNLHSAYLTLSISTERPIKGYMQTLKIIIYAVGTIFIVSVLVGKSPGALLASLGAIAAILILVFKDTILGFVSSIQLSANQMVKPGDWISMPSRNADGTVLEITLNTVKVQNWDKTISTIPTYALISESFQNWKGMEDSKGRRIARSVFIDVKTIKFCDLSMLEKFEKIKLIKEYIQTKQKEIEKHNEEMGLEENDRVSRRNLTNVGVFRKYMEMYLDNHPKIHKNKPPYITLVRHLQPTEKGLPIQIYCFSKEQAWGDYEQIQADIFDHILAVVPEFKLNIFQNPSGNDLKQLSHITAKE